MITYRTYEVCPFCQSVDCIQGGQCPEVTCTKCKTEFDWMQVINAISHSEIRRKVKELLTNTPNVDGLLE